MDTVLKEPSSLAPVVQHPKIPGFAVGLEGVLTPEECDAIVQIAEDKGFVPAALYTDLAGNNHMNTDVRKSYRCIIDSVPFAQQLWERVKHAVPATFQRGFLNHTVVGLNERIRVLRYYPGDEFKPHSDGQYVAPNGDISQITLLLYLNEGYQGGYTTFFTADQTELIPIQPKTGMVVLQDQRLLHGVPPLLEGVKYAIRTDVMYRPPKEEPGEVRNVVIRE